MRLLALLTVALTPFVVDDSHQQATTRDQRIHHSQRWRAMHAANRLCSQVRVTACIRYATLKYRQPYGDAVRVARCESSLDPNEEYAGHRGVFQFDYPGTWSTTPYRRYDPYSARWNSLAAMWMWSVGRRSEWQCQ